jgi:hypothetical protein
VTEAEPILLGIPRHRIIEYHWGDSGRNICMLRCKMLCCAVCSTAPLAEA